jgi:short-subunit dehydrogenase
MQQDASGFRAKYGPWALVAGGSSGMGAEFATQLARMGLDLVLVAEAAEPLEAHADSIRGAHGVEIRTAVVDLGDRDVLERLRAATRGLEIGLLVYNAAHSYVGRFLDEDIASRLKTIDVNCRGPVLLAHEYGRAMAERGRGGILLMSSLAGLQGCALVATYAATKAFDLVLGESLWDELGEHGVDVLAFCAGATRTPNYESTRPRRTGFAAPPVMEIEPVVAEALAALGRGPSRIAGRANRVAASLLQRVLPRRVAVGTMGRTMRSVYPR